MTSLTFGEIYKTLRPLLLQNHDEALVSIIGNQVKAIRSRFDVSVFGIPGYPQALADIMGDCEGCFCVVGSGFKDVWLDRGYCDRLAQQLGITKGAVLESFLLHEVGHIVEPGELEAWTLASNLRKEIAFYSEVSFEAVKKFSLDSYRIYSR